MTATRPVPQWTRRRWGWTIAGLVSLQIALVFWLGDRAPFHRRSSAAEPRVFLTPGYTGELAALQNPTLFAFASGLGFSGLAWQQLPALQYQPTDWTEPPRFLELSLVDLDSFLHSIIHSNATTPFEVAAKAEPTILRSALPTAAQIMPTQSVVRVEGPLADRKLLTPFTLPPLRAGDLVPDTVVQAEVDVDGRTQSATLLTSSGVASADQLALDLTRAARFESQRRGAEAPTAELTWGRLVFSWLTLPLPATNAPAAAP